MRFPLRVEFRLDHWEGVGQRRESGYYVGWLERGRGRERWMGEF